MEQENSKMAWIWGVIILVVVILVIWLLVGNKGTPNTGTVSTSTATTTTTSISYGTNFAATSTEGILFRYLSANISRISPQKEVLGGKFLITNLVVTSSNTAEVSYSDGHIALAGRFNFAIDGNGNVTITNFVMLTDKL